MMVRMSTPRQAEPQDVAALQTARHFTAALTLPLELPDAPEMRRSAAAAVAQLDDYILPRLRSLDAPLLAVVGGSTGAGKSTLVNALVGRAVTRAGAVRPTTRQPMLLHHPDDRGWFEGQRVLPALSRVSDEAESQHAQAAGTLRLHAEPAVPRGLALLDAPDVDSIADENRTLAGQLLAAADLWLFVTTANRYADAVPWQLLKDAAQRDILLAVVLDRVPAGVEEEIRQDLHSLLARGGLGHAPIFVVPEAQLDSGMLGASHVEPVLRWLRTIAADAGSRSEVARRTLNGAVRSLGVRMKQLAGAADAQESARTRLRTASESAYDDALVRIMDATRDGALLRGEVLARWQDFVGTGEFFRGVESGIGRVRDRIGAFLTGKPAPVETVETAIETGLHAVIVEESAKARDLAERRWRADPAGQVLLSSKAAPQDGEFAGNVALQIRQWQGYILELVRAEGAAKRSTARLLSFGLNGLAVALMVVVFASSAGLSGLEIGIAGSSAVVGQKLLEAVFGEDAVRRLARKARDDLQERCAVLLAAERRHFTDALRPPGTEPTAAQLRAAAARLAGVVEVPG
jgi:energy-coupling factor transporter ATP-binding protein EcfA2